MKIEILLALSLGVFTQQINAQERSADRPQKNRFGFVAMFGASTQVHSYPNVANYPNVTLTTPEGQRNFRSEAEYGKYGESPLPIFGLGLNYTHYVDSWFLVKPQLRYIQKGSSYRGRVNIIRNGNQTSISVGSDGDRFEFNNKFHYLATDLLFVFQMKKWKTKPYFQTGLRGDFLLSKNITYDIDEFSQNRQTFGTNDIDLTKTNYRDFNHFNYGLLTGIGIAFSTGWYLELNTDADFGFVVRNEDLKVRNYLANLTLGMGL